MDSATEANTNGKRARTIDEEAQLSSSASPLEKAKFCAHVALASLPATIKSLVQGFHNEFLALKTELLRLSKTRERLSQADYVPVSARIKFALTASPRVMEHADAQFQELAERTASHLVFYQTEVKAELLKLNDIEQNLARDALNQTFCKAVGAIGIAIAINHPDVAAAHSKDLIALVFEHHYEVLLMHTTIATPQEFFDTLKTATLDPAPAHTFPSLNDIQTERVLPAATVLKDLLNALFVRSWDNYLAAKEDQARQLTLKEFVDLTLKEQSTAPVAMDFDQVTTNSPELAAFITDQVTKSTAKLRSQVSHLQKATTPRTSKNKPRGAPPSSARHTKKTDAQNKNKSKTDGKPGQKVAGAANATTKDSRTRGDGRPRKKSVRSNRNSSQKK
jgi:hypothetical protein